MYQMNRRCIITIITVLTKHRCNRCIIAIPNRRYFRSRYAQYLSLPGGKKEISTVIKNSYFKRKHLGNKDAMISRRNVVHFSGLFETE